MSHLAALKAILRIGMAYAALIACGTQPEAKPATAPTPAATRPPAQPPADPGPKVAFLGDSISAGLHLPADEAFPAVLQRRLQAQGLAFTLINAGVSGDTTAGGLRRVDWLLKQRPDVLVIELGCNDGLRGIALAAIEANLRAIIAKTRAAGVTPLLLGMRIPTSYGDDYAAAFDAIYPRLADELGVRAVPFFMQGVGGEPAMNLEDGLHPTTAGHERLANQVEPALRELLTALPRPAP
jgi:acyl-CoA thioesterase I